MVIGSGIDIDYQLWNYIPHSLFVGFKTNVPTLFVGGPDHRVGIGTGSPEAKLHVEGVIEVDQKIQADDFGGLELATDEGTTRLFIGDSGNVGIWTTSPAHALHVAGHEMIQGPDGFNSNGEQATLYLGDTNKYLRATYGGNTTFYSNDPLLIRTGADANQLFLSTVGRVGIGTNTPGYKLQVGDSGDGTEARANAWNIFSSREYKTDISSLGMSDYGEVLQKLQDLDVVQYHYRGDEEDRRLRLGIIAEEAPAELVSEDGKAMSLSDSVGFLLAAVKGLMAENEELRNRINALEEKR
jgi:hypothetical protein